MSVEPTTIDEAERMRVLLEREAERERARHTMTLEQLAALAKCDDTELIRLCSAPGAGGCRLEGLGVSGGLERIQPLKCINCSFPSLGPCLGCAWGSPRQADKVETCEANR